ncbi:Hypothetical_protein [Hexamita inflata]|uniref:Hypothetical_protein n=1 Tax=Hexamita inflata TaxID=28002 RepID=A0AA86R6R0_9EUKA|nr:Hypothetical protein HINF_LOCUS54639 [Hexamita inflata]
MEYGRILDKDIYHFLETTQTDFIETFESKIQLSHTSVSTFKTGSTRHLCLISKDPTGPTESSADQFYPVRLYYIFRNWFSIAPEEVKLELLKFNFIIKFIYSYFQEYMQIPRQKLSQKMKYYPNTENILIVKSNIKGKEAINTKISILNKLIYFLIIGKTTLIKKSENLIMI